ncbi:MAG: 2,3-bisphosphoglycerate-independent phosphoglycerate mutase [Candidatus Lokiarchaeota archaeon]|nr:2,3-bisphosphoglycerate-independent phosphoglycerate mutase [Candidatus Lokiarchaeota archaeon]MBD3340880.1 2,3-bisphosphoglycerate-independent phosphoglycerate mutase [Candidatus Lokiarchaeota archaeon]
MDGIGLGKKNTANAFYLANTLFIDKLQRECPNLNLYTELKAHGTAVGLPTNEEMGNSEVGHNAMGAGQVVKQRALLAKESILSKNLFKTQKWLDLTSKLKKTEKTFHLIGLLSDGYVHSHLSHLIGLLRGAKESDIKKVRIHTLFDGRDVPPQSADKYINQLEEELAKINDGTQYDYSIASGGGRMRVTMDRYNSDWDVVRRGWEAHVCGIPEQLSRFKGYFKSALDAIHQARKMDSDISDQYIPAFVIVDDQDNPVGKMEDGDAVLFFNFRGDRAIQISRAFDEEDFSEFEKKCNPEVFYYGLLKYDDEADIPNNYFIEPPEIKNCLTNYLCAEKIKQFAIAETHKFGHVTYFWNGNNEGYVCEDYEKYIEIKSDPSEKIKEFPKMKAFEVLDRLKKAINGEEYKFLRVNFANGDMVGHTGSKKAAMIAAETVDKCVEEIVKLVNEKKGITIVTADHGNLEEMEEMETSHTLNPVMFAIVDSNYDREYRISQKLESPQLGNIAATILNLLGYKKPEEYMESLIEFE